MKNPPLRINRESLNGEAGVTIVENLVALVIIAIAALSVVPLLRIAMNTTAAARTHAAIIAEVEDIFATYRTTPLIATLGQISNDLGSLQNGDSTVIHTESEVARANYDITITAMRDGGVGAPEGARLRIEAIHRRGILGDANYIFETVLTDVR